MKIKDKSRSSYHWLVVAACCGLSCTSMGIACNCMGVFYTPVADALGVGRGNIAMYSTIINIVGGFMGPVIVKLMDKLNFRLMLASGLTIMCLAEASMALAGSPWALYISSLFIGIGFSATAVIPITIIINNWFQEKHGFATGLALCFSGIGGAVFNPVLSALISSVGWRMSYVIAAVIMAVICLPGILFVIRLKPAEKGLLPYGGTAEAESSPKVKAKDERPGSLISLPFIAVCAFGLLCSFVTGLSPHFPGLSEEFGQQASVGAFMVSSGMLGNVVFKLLIGVMSDKIGAIKACTVMFCINIFAMLVLMFVPEGQLLIPMAAAFLYGAIFAVSAVGLSLVTKQVFGVKKYSRVYSFVSMSGFVGGAFAISMIGFIYDIFGSYKIAVLVCIILSTLSMVIMHLVARRANKDRI